MNTYLYIAVVTSVPHGEFLGKVAAFDIDNFNVIFITNYENEYYCKTVDRTKVDFGELSKEEVCNIIKKYSIYPLESGISNFKEILEETYKEYPEFTRHFDKDFNIISKEEFIEKLENSYNNRIKFNKVYI
jgi:hypothetical protein